MHGEFAAQCKSTKSAPMCGNRNPTTILVSYKTSVYLASSFAQPHTQLLSDTTRPCPQQAFLKAHGWPQDKVGKFSTAVTFKIFSSDSLKLYIIYSILAKSSWGVHSKCYLYTQLISEAGAGSMWSIAWSMKVDQGGPPFQSSCIF